jgi:hypothetical protein
MAFVLQQSPTYSWPVRILIPTDGRREQFTFTARFNRLKQSRIKELVAISQSEDESISDLQLLGEILGGWDDVMDDAGKPVAFSKVALEQMAELPTVAGQIATAYFESLTEAKRKN